MIPGSQSQLPTELAAFVATHFADRQSNPDRLIAESWHRSVNQHGLDPARAASHVQLESHIPVFKPSWYMLLNLLRAGASGTCSYQADMMCAGMYTSPVSGL